MSRGQRSMKRSCIGWVVAFVEFVEFRAWSFVDRSFMGVSWTEVSWKFRGSFVDRKFRGQSFVKFRGQKFRGQTGRALCGNRYTLRFECKFRLASIRNDLFSGSAL